MSVWLISIELFSSSLVLSYALSSLPFNTCFISDIVFSSSQIFIWLFFKGFHFSLNISHLGGNICTNLSFLLKFSNISIMLILKFLSSNSNIWVFCQFSSTDWVFLLIMGHLFSLLWMPSSFRLNKGHRGWYTAEALDSVTPLGRVLPFVLAGSSITKNRLDLVEVWVLALKGQVHSSFFLVLQRSP